MAPEFKALSQLFHCVCFSSDPPRSSPPMGYFYRSVFLLCCIAHIHAYAFILYSSIHTFSVPYLSPRASWNFGSCSLMCTIMHIFWWWRYKGEKYHRVGVSLPDKYNYSLLDSSLGHWSTALPSSNQWP